MNQRTTHLVLPHVFGAPSFDALGTRWRQPAHGEYDRRYTLPSSSDGALFDPYLSLLFCAARRPYTSLYISTGM